MRYFLYLLPLALGACKGQAPDPLHDDMPTKGDILVLFGTKDEVTRFTGETS